jgi:hypothetical protein
VADAAGAIFNKQRGHNYDPLPLVPGFASGLPKSEWPIPLTFLSAANDLFRLDYSNF